MVKIDTGSKFKMAAAPILKITFLAIARPLLHAFAPNLKQRLKMGTHRQIDRRNSHNQKSKMAAAAILKSIKRQ